MKLYSVFFTFIMILVSKSVYAGDRGQEDGGVYPADSGDCFKTLAAAGSGGYTKALLAGMHNKEREGLFTERYERTVGLDGKPYNRHYITKIVDGSPVEKLAQIDCLGTYFNDHGGTYQIWRVHGNIVRVDE